MQGGLISLSNDVLTQYDSLVSRIAKLEAEQVEVALRPAENKLRGLQQSLSAYESTLRELHNNVVYRARLTHQVEEAWDPLGKKHKRHKLIQKREAEGAAMHAELAQQQEILELRERMERQRALVADLRRKVLELEWVRQAEADLVDRLFRRQGVVADQQHGALEDALAGLAPRLFQMRERAAVYPQVHAKLESARHQLQAAAKELERAYEPAHKELKEKHGSHAGEEIFYTADMGTKRRALVTADKLAKAAAHNLQKARLRLESLPGLQPAEVTQLESCLEGTFGHGADEESLTTRKRVRDAIYILYVFISQTEFAARAVRDMEAGLQASLRRFEEQFSDGKSKLDLHRRSLLSQVQEAKRSNSLKSLGGESASSESFRSTSFDLASKNKSFASMGAKVPSVNSNLSDMG